MNTNILGDVLKDHKGVHLKLEEEAAQKRTQVGGGGGGGGGGEGVSSLSPAVAMNAVTIPATLSRALSAGAVVKVEAEAANALAQVKKEADDNAQKTLAVARATQAALTKVLQGSSAIQLPIPSQPAPAQQQQPALAHLQQQDTNVCLLQSLGLLPTAATAAAAPTPTTTTTSALAANLLGLSEGLRLSALAQGAPLATQLPTLHQARATAMTPLAHHHHPHQRLMVVKEKASPYRGITRRKKRWEAHVWRHGKQAYLGGYREEEAAARAYDMAVIKIRGLEAETNFPVARYVQALKAMNADALSVEEFIMEMREQAKRRSKQLREEEEDKRIEVLKQINEESALSTFLVEQQQQQQQQQSRHQTTQLSALAAAQVAQTAGGDPQQLREDALHMELLKKINTEATLDRYLELARGGQKRKREDDLVAASTSAEKGQPSSLHQHQQQQQQLPTTSLGLATSLIQRGLGISVDPSKNASHTTSEQLLSQVVCGPNCQAPCTDPLHKSFAGVLEEHRQSQQQQQLQVLQALQLQVLQAQQEKQQKQQQQQQQQQAVVAAAGNGPAAVSVGVGASASSAALLSQLLEAGALQAPSIQQPQQPQPQQPQPQQQQEPDSARTNQSDATTLSRD